MTQRWQCTYKYKSATAALILFFCCVLFKVKWKIACNENASMHAHSTAHLFCISERSQFLVRQHLVASHIHSMWHNQTTEGWHGACMKSVTNQPLLIFITNIWAWTHIQFSYLFKKIFMIGSTNCIPFISGDSLILFIHQHKKLNLPLLMYLHLQHGIPHPTMVCSNRVGGSLALSTGLGAQLIMVVIGHTILYAMRP